MTSSADPQGAGPVAARSALTVTRHALSEPLPGEVRDLFQQAAGLNLESTWHWYTHLHLSLFSADPGMALWVLRDGARVLAALPVRLDGSRSMRTLRPLAHDFYTALFTPAIAPDATPEDLALLLRRLMQAHRPLHCLQFAPLDADAPTFKLLEQGLRAAGWRTFRYFCFDNWSLSTPASWAAYLASRSPNQRSAIRRGGRKLSDRGGRIEIITDPAEVARGMRAYWQVYAASWKQEEPFQEFIDGLARTCAEQGELRLGLAWLDEQPIAAQLWMVGHGRAEIVKLAYAETHKDLAPGNALTAALLRHAIEHDHVQQVDYLIGGDGYKRTWMSHRVERWGLVAYNPRKPLGLLGWARQALSERTRRWRVRAASSAPEAMATPTPPPEDAP